MSRRVLLSLVLLGGLSSGACQGPPAGPYAEGQTSPRDTARAQKLSREAADLLDEDPDEAEALLREALTADLFYGPAHNNLGVLFLGRGQLYEAAQEFEWARKLMPGHPDPRVNLALTLEQAGRTDEAIQSYETALQVYSDYLPALQGLVRLRVERGEIDEETIRGLNEVALRAPSADWREWAQGQLVRLRL